MSLPLPASLRRLLAAVLLAVPLLLASSAGAAEWALGLGVFDIHDGGDRATEASFEVRTEPVFRFRAIDFVPVFGIAGTEDGNFWGVAGLRGQWDLTPRWRITPHFAVGLYEDGDGKDLGGPVEFRSGLEISRVISGDVRLGLTYYHLSNSRLYDLNPGSESLLLVLSF